MTAITYILTAFFMICFGHTIYGEDPAVKLTADDLIYHSAEDRLTATSNVTLSYGGVTITADRLDILGDHTVVGSQNLTIQRGASKFNPSYLSFNLEKNEVTISDIAIQIENHENKTHPIYVRATTLTDRPDLKKGASGIITSCNHDPPHYYATASHFDYYPDERVVAFNVSHYNPILGLPLFLWTPVYSYDLGNRRIVWNFPTIGKKETGGWGWFIQNTFDYDRIDGKDSSVYVDWFSQDEFPATKGWGLGIEHQYKFDDHSGSVYFYQLEEQDTKQVNNKKSFSYAYQPSDFLKTNLSYSQKQGAKINNPGFENNEAKSFSYAYDELGNKYDFSLAESQNFHSPKSELSAAFSRTYNDNKYVDFSWRQNNNYVAGQQSSVGSLDFLTFVPGGKFTQSFDYYGKDEFAADDADIQRLRYDTRYTHTFSSNLSLGVNVASQIPMKELPPTANTSDYDMFYKLPEVTLNLKKQKVLGFETTHELLVARYQERRYTVGKTREFPLNDEFSLDPNTYAYTGTFSQSVSKLPFSSTFKMSGSFLQYIFNTPGKDVFNGDAFYKFSIKPSLTSSYFGFIKSTTVFDWSHIPDDANSPFNKFSSYTSVAAISNKITETLTFDVLHKDIGYWKHSSGYDWIRQKPDSYNTHLSLKPAAHTKFDVSTGRNLEAGTWHNLDTDISYSPTKNQLISFGVEQDLNQGKINNSTLTLRFPIGDDPDYQWAIESQFSYTPGTNARAYDVNKYELKTLHIVKHDHCRTFDIAYSKPREEFTFSLTIDAFPKDKIGIKKTKNLYKLEGILDESSKERL